MSLRTHSTCRLEPSSSAQALLVMHYKAARSPFPPMAIRQSWEEAATIVVPVRHGFTHAQEVYGPSRERSSSAQAVLLLRIKASQSTFPPMAIRQSWEDLATIFLPVRHGSTHAQEVCGRSRERSSSAQALWVLQVKARPSTFPPMAIRRSWVDLATIMVPVRHGSSHAQAVCGRSKERSSSAQALWVLQVKALQSPFPRMAIRQLWAGLPTIVGSVRPGCT